MRAAVSLYLASVLRLVSEWRTIHSGQPLPRFIESNSVNRTSGE